MCSVCKRFFCLSSCPSFTGISAELGNRLFRCSVCGRWIYEADEYTIDYGKPYCDSCNIAAARLEKQLCKN